MVALPVDLLKLFVRSRGFDELVMKTERLALILNPREGLHYALVKILWEEEGTTYCKHLCLAQITKHDKDAPQSRGDIWIEEIPAGGGGGGGGGAWASIASRILVGDAQL